MSSFHKVIFIAIASFFVLGLVACGDDSSSSDYVEETDELDDGESSASKSGKSSSSQLLEKGSITGVAQKGPFLKGSSVLVYEVDTAMMRKNGMTTATVLRKANTYETEVGGNDGSFSIKDSSLVGPYVLLKVSGFFFDEVSGKESSDSLSLYAFVDLDERDHANVNILTNMESNRIYNEIAKGKNMDEAKKLARKEVLAAFGLEDDFGNFEDMDIRGESEGDALLLAVSLIMASDASSEELKERLSKFNDSMLRKSSWDDEKSKSAITKFILEHESGGFYKDVRDTLKKMTKKSVGDFEKYLYHFWSYYYKLGKCTKDDEGEIRVNGNPNASLPENVDRFVCKSGHWTVASDSDKGGDANVDVENGGLKTDDDGAVFVYDGDVGAWRAADSVEMVLGGCTSATADSSGMYKEGQYKICVNDPYRWVDATESEADTYKWKAGKLGELRKGKVTGKIYVYFTGYKPWRLANDIEAKYGGCTVNMTDSMAVMTDYDLYNSMTREYEHHDGPDYYSCFDGLQQQWKIMEEYEVVTFYWEPGEDGELRKSDETGEYYKFSEAIYRWDETDELDLELGIGCTRERDETVFEKDGDTYQCEYGKWSKVENVNMLSEDDD